MMTTDITSLTTINTNVTTDIQGTIIRDGPVFDAANREMFEIYIYPLVLTLVLMFIGLFGNAIVIYLFTFQWKLTKPTIFILTLAWVDIFSCVFNMPIEAAMLWHPLDFDLDALCKVSRFTTFVTSAGSSFVLCAIAIDRYIMVCRPFQSRTMGIPYARKMCMVAVLLGVVSTWPSLIFYGTYTYYIPDTDQENTAQIEGKTCLITNYFIEHNTVPVAFYMFLFGGHVIMFIILMTMYVLIGRQLYISANSEVSEDRRHSAKFLGLSLVSAITGAIPHSDTRSMGSRSCSRAVSMENLNIRIDRNPNPFSPEGINTTPRPSAGTGDVLALGVHTTGTPRHSIGTGDPSGHRVRTTGNSVRRNSDGGAIEHADNTIIDMERGNCQCSCANGGVHSDTENRIGEDNMEAKLPASYRLNLPAAEYNNGGYRCHGCKRTTGRMSSLTTANDICMTPVTPDSTRQIISRSHSVESKSKYNRILADELRMLEVKEFSLKRNTLIMRMVTMAFIFSFLPYLIIVTIRYSDPDHIPGKLSKGSQIAYHVFLRTYFMSSMINPLIYGFMNEEFRLKLKDMCFKICRNWRK